MAGDNVETPADLPVGHGDTRGGGDRNGGRDAGDHLKGDSGPLQGQSFFPPAAKHEGVPALEPGHADTLAGQVNEGLADFLLRGGGPSRPLAHGDSLRLRGSQLQQSGVDQVVVYHGLADLQAAQAPEGEQIRRPAARADEKDPAGVQILGQPLRAGADILGGVQALGQTALQKTPQIRGGGGIFPAGGDAHAGRSPADQGRE